MTPVALLRVLLIPEAQLAIEDLALRQRSAVLRRRVQRPWIRARDRISWVLLCRLPPGGWPDAVGFDQPATVVAWHREGGHVLWRARSTGRPSRPPISSVVQDLIRRLSRENRLWRLSRIQDGLKSPGHRVARSTIEKYMQRPSRPPSPAWRAFLDHMLALGEGHARRLLEEYIRDDDLERSHPALDGETPAAENEAQESDGPIAGPPSLGGLHNGYPRVARRSQEASVLPGRRTRR
jgi:hypothetical protein